MKNIPVKTFVPHCSPFVRQQSRAVVDEHPRSVRCLMCPGAQSEGPVVHFTGGGCQIWKEPTPFGGEFERGSHPSLSRDPTAGHSIFSRGTAHTTAQRGCEVAQSQGASRSLIRTEVSAQRSRMRPKTQRSYEGPKEEDTTDTRNQEQDMANSLLQQGTGPRRDGREAGGCAQQQLVLMRCWQMLGSEGVPGLRTHSE